MAQFDKYGRWINPNYQSQPVSSFTSTYQSHTTYRRNIWQRMNDFVADIGEWIDDNRDVLANNLSLGFYYLAWIGLGINVIAQWISSGFWMALLTAVIGSVVVVYAAALGMVILDYFLRVFFFVARYILYNIYTLSIFIAMILSPFLFNGIDILKNETPVVSNTVSSHAVSSQANYYCNTTSLNVRSAANKNANIVGKLTKNQELYVHSINNGFAKIDFNGSIAYASADYLKPKGEVTSINSSAQTSNRNKTTAIPSKVSNINNSNTAKINRIWEEHNVFQDQQKGMKIHVKFNTYNMQNMQGKCIAYFYYSNGTILKDNNNSYRSSDGQVIVERNFKPGYKETLYEDFALFIPYSELHLPSEGKTNLKAHVVLQASSTTTQPKKLTTSDWIHFMIW